MNKEAQEPVRNPARDGCDQKKAASYLGATKKPHQHFGAACGDKFKKPVLMDEELYWKQRSMDNWLKAGDKNTKFFHFRTSPKKRKKRIEGVQDKAGNWVYDKEEVQNIFCEYFQDLFTSSRPSMDQINAALQGVAPKVTAEMNALLEQPLRT